MTTPFKAIREHCLWCCNGSASEVSLCVIKSCPLWTLRFGAVVNDERTARPPDTRLHPFETPMTAAEFEAGGSKRLQAIQRRCLDCSGYNRAEVKGCKFKDCTLWPYREGHNPARAGTGRREGIFSSLLRKSPAQEPISEDEEVSG